MQTNEAADSWRLWPRLRTKSDRERFTHTTTIKCPHTKTTFGERRSHTDDDYCIAGSPRRPAEFLISCALCSGCPLKSGIYDIRFDCHVFAARRHHTFGASDSTRAAIDILKFTIFNRECWNAINHETEHIGRCYEASEKYGNTEIHQVNIRNKYTEQSRNEYHSILLSSRFGLPDAEVPLTWTGGDSEELIMRNWSGKREDCWLLRRQLTWNDWMNETIFFTGQPKVSVGTGSLIQNAQFIFARCPVTKEN